MILREFGKKGQFSRNVAFAWGGFVAQAAAGVIMPRLISDSLGQSTLGVWDLAWNLVSYLGFIELGLSGSVNRFVARYRATKDTGSLTRSVSTVDLFLKLAGAAAMLLTIIAVVWLLPLSSDRFGTDLFTMQLVILWLGLEISVSLMFAANLGVIVGCLRSDLHYTVSAAVYTLATLGMTAAVLAGGGLPAIAFVHASVTAGGEAARWWLARRVCPELLVDYSTASWDTWREQARFTAKSTLPTVADMIVNQSVGVLVAFYLGAPALAIFSRPRNLVRQVRTLVARFGYILIPAASSMHARSENDELVRTLREKSRQVALATMPLAVTLAVVGDDLIRFWMGEAYVVHGLVAILALGALATWIQEPAWSILVGMNRHGGLAAAKLLGSVCAAAVLAVGLAFYDWRLTFVAMALVVPMAVVDAVVVPLFVCRAFRVRLSEYYLDTWLRPASVVTPYAVFLILSRLLFGSEPLAMGAGVVVSGLVLAFVYWVAVLPSSVRNGILRRQSA